MADKKEHDLFSAFVRELKSLPRVKAPQGLADDVLQNIRTQASPAAPAKMIPFNAPLLALAAALLIVLGGAFYLKLRNSAPDIAVLKRVRFECVNPDAGSVSLVGDFNQWNKEACLLQKGDDGKWFVEVTLKPGAYQYQFLINGSTWTPDQKNPVLIDDGFGGVNSGIEI
jgi:hypothetical protein